MKSPYVIAVLSLIPGLGFIFLRRIKVGLLVWLLEGLGAWIFLASSSVVLAALGIIVVVATWVLQLHYAIQIAKREDRRRKTAEASLHVYRNGEGTREDEQVSADSIIQPYLAPEEHLLASAVGMRPQPGGLGRQQFAVGVTHGDLIIVRLRPWGMADTIERIPLNRVSASHLEEGTLTDEIELQVEGEAEPRAFYFYPISRALVITIAEALESGGEASGGERGDDP